MSTIATIMLLSGALYLVFRPREQPDVPNRRRSRWSNPYPATSIRHQAGACPAVKSMADTRFLAWEAPTIPLPACNAQTCGCRYTYHPDRRTPGADRRNDMQAQAVDRGFDRRRGKDRRLASIGMPAPGQPGNLSSPGMPRP